MVPPDRDTQALGRASGDVSQSQIQATGAAKAQANQQAGAQAVSRIAGASGLAELLVDNPSAKQIAAIVHWIDAAKPAQLAAVIPSLSDEQLIGRVWNPLVNHGHDAQIGRVMLYASSEQQHNLAPSAASLSYSSVDPAEVDALRRFLSVLTPSQQFEVTVSLKTETLGRLRAAEGKGPHVGNDPRVIGKNEAEQAAWAFNNDDHAKSGVGSLEYVRGRMGGFSPAVRAKVLRQVIDEKDWSYDAVRLVLALSPAEQKPFIGKILGHADLADQVLGVMGFYDEPKNPNRQAAEWRTLPAVIRSKVLEQTIGKQLNAASLEVALIASPAERHPYLEKIIRIEDDSLLTGLDPAYLPRVRALATEVANEPFFQRIWHGDAGHQRHLVGIAEIAARLTVQGQHFTNTETDDELDANRVLPAQLTDPAELRRRFNAEKDLNHMRALAERRFGIQFNHVSAVALRRMWPVLERLPRNDVLSAKRIIANVEDNSKEGGDWAGDRIHIDGSLADPHSDPQYFDEAVRHEVGHAVDQQLGITEKHGSQVPFGGWREHSDPEALAAEIVQASHAGIAAMHDAKQRKDVIHYVAQIISGEKHVSGFEHFELGLWAKLNPFSLGKQARDPALEAVFAGIDPTRSWTNVPELAGRCYRRMNADNPGFWVSYAAVAKRHKVSDYQFCSRAEWFAEAYVHFYDPKYADPTKDNDLKRHDPTMHDFFVKNVHMKTPPPTSDQRKVG